MKTTKYISILLLTAALLACNRETLRDDAPSQLSAEEGMTFKASLAPISRSVFGDDPDNSGVLYWEDSDRVLIAAALQCEFGDWSNMSAKIDAYCTELAQGRTDGSYIGRDFNRYVHTTIATPEIQTDRTQALLHTKISPKSLFPERGEYDDPAYEILAIYPVTQIRPMKLIAMYGEYGDAAVGFPVEVAHVQNGKDFGRYHVCMDTGFDVESPTLGFYRSSEIIDGEVEVAFNRIKPVTSMLRFDIRTDNPDPVEIAKLVIDMKGVSDTKLSGSAWVSTWGDDPWIIPDRWGDDNYNDVEIVFDTPITVSSTPTTEKYCAVLLPSFKDKSAPDFANQYGADPIEFRAYAADGTLLFRTTKNAPSGDQYGEKPGFRLGGRYDFTLNLLTETPPDGALSGQFSLAEGRKAYIATGNLWAYVNADGTRDQTIANNGWKLAPHQYDICNYDYTKFGTSEGAGWIDLFGFSTEANDHGISISMLDSDYSGDAAGWTDCMAAKGWRTITADEGVYLFSERTNALGLFAYATVYVGTENNPVKGLVFLPDNWTTPAGCSFTPINEIDGMFDFNVNLYKAEGATLGSCGDWENMEANGAVFWPVAGKRVGTAVDYNVGSYWSGTPNDNWGPEYADLLLFDSTQFSPKENYRYIGGCVRLVRDVSE